jgi:hypothetical protein
MCSNHLDRRRFLQVVSGTAAALVPALPAIAQSRTDHPELRAGTAVTEIATPLEVGILMSSSAGRWEPFEGVRLPLQARVVVLERGPRRIAIAALDLLGLAGEALGGIDSFKKRITAAASQAIAPDDLVLACSHTHSAPESIALTDLPGTRAFQNWVDDLAEAIGRAVKDATGALRPCGLRAGTHPAPGLTVNRRIRTTRGIASVRRQLPPDVVIGPEGPNDDAVRVAALVDKSDEPLAMFVNFTAHPVLEMCIKQVSPDYPGEMSLELERRHPGCVALFLQGACGNINPPTMDRSAVNARQYGQRLAALVDEALGELQPVGSDELVLAWRTVRLPVRSLDGQLEEEPLVTKIGALRIGQAAWVFLPGEPFVEIALAIQEASPWSFTAVAGYAEDYIGYIPTNRAFDNGGYEIGPGRWSLVARGSEPIVRREAVKLLEKLRERRALTD